MKGSILALYAYRLPKAHMTSRGMELWSLYEQTTARRLFLTDNFTYTLSTPNRMSWEPRAIAELGEMPDIGHRTVSGKRPLAQPAAAVALKQITDVAASLPPLRQMVPKAAVALAHETESTVVGAASLWHDKCEQCKEHRMVCRDGKAGLQGTQGEPHVSTDCLACRSRSSKAREEGTALEPCEWKPKDWALSTGAIYELQRELQRS